MLSRVASSRLGSRLTAVRFPNPAVSPIARAWQRPLVVTSTVRTYAKPHGPNSTPRDAKAKNPSEPQNSSSRSPEEPVASERGQDGVESSKEGEPLPFHKLPDLTQGIPSTLEQEMDERSGRSQRSQSALEAVDPYDSSGRDRGDRSEYVSTNEQNRRWWARALLSLAGGGALVSIAYMGRNWDDAIEANRHPDVPNGWSPSLWWQRAAARWGESVSYYQDPAFDKLLPDPHPSFERPYTLCLSLDDLLIHSEWSRDHGWRVAKRPGVDYFIRYLSQYYELVLFTTVSFAMGEPVVRKLDPFRFIMWPLYREATKYEDGEIVKDLSYLNRDLSKVIIIDTKKEHIRKQPENGIILDPWKGDPNDKELVGLIPFLEYIHTMQYSDVRKVLKSFDGKHIPTEFARREAIARKEFQAQLKEKSSRSTSSGLGALGGLLGMKPSNMSMTMAPEGEQNPSEAFAQGKMLQDIARERGQRNYEMLEREIRENGEKWLKEEQAAMEQAQKEAMNSMMSSFSGVWGVKKDENSGVDKKP